MSLQAPGDGAASEARGVKSAERTLDVLEELARARSPRSLGDLAGALGIPKSSLHGLLRTLERRQWVESDDTNLRFRLGLRALQLVSSHAAQDRETRVTRAVMARISEETGETVQLARLVGAEIVYLAQLPARHPVRLVSAVGERLPAHATALGKALLAARADDELAEILQPPLRPLTEKTVTGWDDLRSALRIARESGVAWDEEEASQGLVCAATVIPARGLPSHAVSVSVPTFRLSEELRRRIPALLLESAQLLVHELGGPPSFEEAF